MEDEKKRCYIDVIRYYFTDEFTQGMLFINDEYFCDVIEPFDSNVKKSAGSSYVKKAKDKYKKMAIPIGEYEIRLTYSNRFKKVLPLINRVPSFEGVRQHAGNTVQDTVGCQILGKRTNTAGVVSDSQNTMKEYMMYLNYAHDDAIPIRLRITQQRKKEQL